MRFQRFALAALAALLIAAIFWSHRRPAPTGPMAAASNAASAAPVAGGISPAGGTPRVAAVALPPMTLPTAYAGAWDEPLPPAFAAFRAWAQRHRQAASPAARVALEPEGVRLARARRAEMAALIRRDPARALALAVPVAVRRDLPAAVEGELEQRVAGTGDFSVWCAAFPGGAHRHDEDRRIATIGGAVYEAHVYGRRERQQTKYGVSLHGIALDGHLALHESPLRCFEAGEPVDGARDPFTLSPAAAAAGGGAAPFAAHGRVWLASGGTALALAESGMIAAESVTGPEVAPVLLSVPLSEGNAPQPLADSWTTGAKKTLVIRIDFADLPGTPNLYYIANGSVELEDFTVENALRCINDTFGPQLNAFSYGALSVVPTVSAKVYRMPQTASYYATQDKLEELRADALAAVGTDYDPGQFDRVAIVMGRVSNLPGTKWTWNGVAELGGKALTFEGSVVDCFVHEFGHTLGLVHANLWQTSDGNPVSEQGTSREYGDIADAMGLGNDASIAAHFNPWYKSLLGWLPDSAVRDVAASGVYRVHAFDHAAALATTPVALRILRDGQREYWIGLRPNLARDNPSVKNGAYVIWGSLAGGGRNSLLLDLTPPFHTGPGFPPPDLAAGLAVGATLNDATFGIALTPIASGGTGAARYLDVRVELPARPPTVPTVWGEPYEGTTDVPGGLRDLRAVAAGPAHCVALKNDGTVVAWGNFADAVPGDLGPAKAIAAAKSSRIVGAVKLAGTVAVWGTDAARVGNAPAGLSGVRQLAIGSSHALALKADGTVTGWGTDATAAAVPARLANVKAVAAGTGFSLALKSDGTVTGWGRAVSAQVPAGLTGVTAIAAGFGFALALKADGTVVAWGDNTFGQTDVPAGLTRVAAIAAGEMYALALKDDGTVAGWGWNLQHQCEPPARLPRAGAIAAGWRQSIAILGAPQFAVTLPELESSTAGATTTLGVRAPGATIGWLRDGSAIGGASGATLALANVQPADSGLYAAQLTGGAVTVATLPAIIGAATNLKVIGSGSEVGFNIRHPNGNYYDQVLLGGAAATITADAGQATRVSFVDLQDDIVQVEFSGAGSLSIVLDQPAGPAAPVNYNQAITYMKGHAGIVITGANETTNVLVTSVGKLTAYDPTGHWDLTKPISAGNDPANNGNPIFKNDVTYDGLADIAYLAIATTNGKFGGVRAAGASFFASHGYTGLYAPGVQFQGPVFLNDLNAHDAAVPVLLLGSAADTRVTGGNGEQANGAAVQVSGVTQLRFVAGTNSHGVALPARANQARFEQDGVDVTAQIVANP